MSCAEIQPELVCYHFGEIEPELRDAVESHLRSCSACLDDFLALKREIETAGTDAAPSRAAYARLRRAVERQVRPPRRRPWSWWERPVALLVAGAAVAAAIFVLQTISTGPGSEPRTLSDHARQRPAPVQLR